MRSPKLRAITPVWAQKIEVNRRGDSLRIKGWGHIPTPFDASFGTPRMDILQRFRHYELRCLDQEKTNEGAGIYQFADADSDEKLIAFCKEFGPVQAKVVSTIHEEGETYTVTALQSMKKLREERNKFAAAVTLVQQINLHSKADRMAVLIAMHDTSLYEPDVLRTTFVLSEMLPLNKSNTLKTNDLLSYADIAVCEVFNQFPLKLFPIGRERIELPETQSEGVRNALYFQLRLDHMAQREIGICMECGDHFPVFKRGTQGCKPSCRRALRNRKYWDKNGLTINKSRRSKSKSGSKQSI